MKVRVASAGTGKTTSLVLRYLELVAAGTPLRRIAGMTFTRTAAEELRQRVGIGLRQLLETGAYLERRQPLTPADRPAFEEALRELDGATLTTIHGFMIAALRLVAPIMGLDPDFTVTGEWEAEAIFEEELGSLLYLARDAAHGLHSAWHLLGSEAVPLLRHLFSQRSLAERFTADDDPRNGALLKLFEASYKRFELRLGAVRLPPSEVERRALKMVRTPEALWRLRQRYHLVLIDEFQDVNPLQGRFFEALEQEGLLVEVVGDPKQSIYGFRNADVEFFRRAMKKGQLLPPLQRTRRHAQVLVRFLNRLTTTLAAQGMGFGPAEAPEVEAAGEQRQVRGRLELHWVTGDSPIARLRTAEAELLAARLEALHREHGYGYRQMAVLARSYAGLNQVEMALRRAGLPYVLLQGRGYFERLEVRDLYHALRVGIDPGGLDLGAWLRSPFTQLPLAEVDRVLRSEDPLGTLRNRHADVWERLERIRSWVRATPLSALKALIREPFIAGKRYVDYLDSRARENVDALLFTVARQPPGDIELLLSRLELLSRQRDAGDVPQSGDGISLLTVHRAKGLEWEVVAVFDLGRKAPAPARSLYLSYEDGAIYHRDALGAEIVREGFQRREEAESYRLFYVAVSRARTVLLMTGSVRNERYVGWSRALEAMGLGPDAGPYERPDFVLRAHPHRSREASGGVPPLDRPALVAAPWIDRVFTHHSYPPVYSPSRLTEETAEASEPLPFRDPEEGELLPGRAATIGTLVHYAISQNWSAAVPRHLENLRAQEVMFPFTPDEQADILDEVALLLSNYEHLLGNSLPTLRERSEDYPELPMALPNGGTVWQGIIDRLYRAAGQWYLDYKTDHEVVPARYHFQLAVYLEAVRRVRKVTPRVRLVYLRKKHIEVIDQDELVDVFRRHAESEASG